MTQEGCTETIVSANVMSSQNRGSSKSLNINTNRAMPHLKGIHKRKWMKLLESLSENLS